MFSSKLLLAGPAALKEPVLPLTLRVGRMDVVKATSAELGPEGGAFVDLGLKASGKRSTRRSLREGDLMLLSVAGP